jgi:hypothetical protein
MADEASDFLKQAHTLARESWETWMSQLKQASGPSSVDAAPGAPMDETVTRSLAGMQSYLDWMQRAVGQASDDAAANQDWQARLQQLFGTVGEPFKQAFEGLDGEAAQGFVQQWQAWLAASGKSGAGGWPPHMPGLGLHREQQEQQQALLAAMLDSLEKQRRYQALILRAHAQGLERLRAALASDATPGQPVESLKALYDLWVDAAESAYAEIALTDEFREVYGAMVNAQMRERQLQQQQLEQYCRQLGLPTRSEVDSLGRRLQEVRRQLRSHDDTAAAQAGEIALLRAELAALKPQRPAPSRTPVKAVILKKAAVAKKRTAAKSAASTRTKPASKRR